LFCTHSKYEIHTPPEFAKISGITIIFFLKIIGSASGKVGPFAASPIILHFRFFAERKVAGYVYRSTGRVSKEGKRPVFDRHGQVFAEIPVVGRAAGVLSWAADANWRYFRPIFEKSVANPWSNRVVGLFVMYTYADDADSLFKTEEFQRQLDSIAAEVSPYLDAIQLITGEEKL